MHTVLKSKIPKTGTISQKGQNCFLFKFYPQFISAVARGGAGGPVPPSFFSQKVKTDLYKMLINKILSPERFETITFVLRSSFFNVRRVMHNDIILAAKN